MANNYKCSSCKKVYEKKCVDLKCKDFKGLDPKNIRSEHYHCINCNKEVQIIIKPMPNEVDISGQAVALTCVN